MNGEPESTQNEIDSILRTELHELGIALKPFVISLLFYPNPDPEPDECIDSGSAVFVDTGKQKILITAEHVISGFEKELQDNNQATLLLAGGRDNTVPEIITEWQVISNSKVRDIATIKIPDDFLISTIGKEYVQLNTWPQNRVTIDEEALLVGYPAGLREVSKRGLELPIVTAKLPISSVSERGFLLAEAMEKREIEFYKEGLPVLTSLGGMSGSPVFVSRESIYELVGVFYEGNGGARGPMFATHLDVLNDDGTIDFSKIP